MLSKCRFDGAEGTVEGVLAMRTMRDVEHVTEMRQCDTTSVAVKLARETDETTSAMVKLARETDESMSDVLNTVEMPPIQYIDRAVDIPDVRGRL